MQKDGIEAYKEYYHSLYVTYLDAKIISLRNASVSHVNPTRSDQETKKLARELSHETYEYLKKRVETLNTPVCYSATKELFIKGSKAEFITQTGGFPREMGKVLRGEISYADAITHEESQTLSSGDRNSDDEAHSSDNDVS
jgi:hypothetical protein